MERHRVANAAFVLAVIALPVIGAAAAGRDLTRLLEFPPPVQIPTDYPRFSWIAAGLAIAVVAAFARSWVRSPAFRRKPSAPSLSPEGGTTNAGRFPPWGWFAVAWTLAWWVLAWTRFAWFGPLQPYTFFPLWLGLIVTFNALAHARTGTCLMQRAPKQWLALFGTSALLWWGFEWLNRFVDNWHYLGAETFSARGYATHATICFATVLPALAAVAEWLGSHRGWMSRAAAGPAWRWLARPLTGWLLILGGATALVLTGARPLHFYPALWLAPLALLLGADLATRRAGAAAEMAAGDWTRAATWMAAALICGFFWELWNWRSFPKWIYTVPFVDRWHIFEMPLLGYAGYLPFGLECLLVVERILGRAHSGIR